jgi:F-type H+-transporting ATPase subunit alpha
VAVLVAASRGVFDDLPLDAVGTAEGRIREAVSGKLADVCRRIRSGEELSEDDLEAIAAAAGKAAADGRDVG